MIRFIVPALLLATGGAALSADQQMSAREQRLYDHVFAGLTPGQPTDCIDPHRITQTYRFGQRIAYAYSRREVFVTDTGGGCFGLERGDAIVSVSPTGRYCRGDIIQTVDLPAHIPSGSCTFGEFVPYIAPGARR